MNPYADGGQPSIISSQFYTKFYNDSHPRKLILGINPGRLGAGATGIPFTDTKRLQSHCGLSVDFHLHEPSSVFVYKMIDAFGGVNPFYSQFYINSVCPLGFVILDSKGKEKNYNYYDSPELTKAVEPFILESLQKQINFGIDTERVFCMGTGKNYKYLNALNQAHGFFDAVVALEHPRYVIQYKAKKMDFYIDKYISLLNA